MRKTKSFCNCNKLTFFDREFYSCSWFERLLLKLVPHFDIVKTNGCLDCNGTGKVQMRNVPVYIDPDWETDTCFECAGTGSITSLYLRRFYIWRSSWIGKNWGDLYLHKIARSDDDPDPHDHPWDFRTFVLKGGYRDEAWRFNEQLVIQNGELRIGGRRDRREDLDDIVRAPATRYRHRRHIHRVIIEDGKPAWTLVWTTGYTHDAKGNADWRFITETRAVPWREYLGLDANEEHGG